MNITNNIKSFLLKAYRLVLDKTISANHKKAIRNAEWAINEIYVGKLSDYAARLQSMVARMEEWRKKLGSFVVYMYREIVWECPECNQTNSTHINEDYLLTEKDGMVDPPQYHFCRGNHGNILHIHREEELKWEVRAIDVVRHSPARWSR